MEEIQQKLKEDEENRVGRILANLKKTVIGLGGVEDAHYPEYLLDFIGIL